jgi:four helix bundle protein
VTYEQWEATVPDAIRADSIWKIEAYRLAVFFADPAWRDVTKLMKDPRTVKHVAQIYRAVGGISTTLSEGYYRTTGRERARYYEFALGSARESRDWYYQVRHVLGQAATDHRIDLATQIVRLTLTMIPDQRRKNQKLSVAPTRP